MSEDMLSPEDLAENIQGDVLYSRITVQKGIEIIKHEIKNEIDRTKGPFFYNAEIEQERIAPIMIRLGPLTALLEKLETELVENEPVVVKPFPDQIRTLLDGGKGMVRQEGQTVVALVGLGAILAELKTHNELVPLPAREIQRWIKKLDGTDYTLRSIEVENSEKRNLS